MIPSRFFVVNANILRIKPLNRFLKITTVVKEDKYYHTL